MIQQEKQLILTDLSARLMYGVRVTWDGVNSITLTPSIFSAIWKDESNDNVPKPLLRSLSSMTEEEAEEYDSIDNRAYTCPKDYAHVPAKERIDWFHKHHFNYSLPEHLFIEVTDENNPYK